MICAHPVCQKEFTPRRPHQKFCSGACRMNNFTAKAPGLQGTVVSLRKIKGGRVSAIIEFATSDEQNALQMAIGQRVEIAK